MQIKYLVTLCCMVCSQALLAQWDGNINTVNNAITNNSYADREALSIPDGSGGIICVWRIFDFSSNVQNIYAQRKNSNGAISWGSATAPVLLYTSTHYLEITDIVADGNGGAYMSWVDNLTDTTSYLVVQKINSNGIIQFAPSGIVVNTNNTHRYSSGQIFANATGFFITWADEIANTLNDIPIYAQVFAQKYNVTGQAQWGADGVQVSNAAGLRASPLIIGDGNNGVFISFLDTRNSGLDSNGDFENIDIFAQHLSSTGSKLWAATDAIVNTEPYNQYTTYGEQSGNTMIADSIGGFYIAFLDYRIGNDSNHHFYIQRLNSNGNRLLASSGVALTTITSKSNRELVKLLYDGLNGVVATWSEHNYNLNIGEVHAKRISNTGNLLWGPTSKIISPVSANGFGSYGVCADQQGNYTFTWIVFKDSTSSNVIKAQKINNNAAKQWDTLGVPICYNALSNPANIAIVKSNTSSIIIWTDDRNITLSSADLYAAKLGTNGSLINTTSTGYVTANNGNWNNGATWIGGLVPPYGANVKVLHSITVNTNVACSSIQVILPGAITVFTGSVVTILR